MMLNSKLVYAIKDFMLVQMVSVFLVKFPQLNVQKVNIIQQHKAALIAHNNVQNVKVLKNVLPA